MTSIPLDPTAPILPDYQVLRRIGRGGYGEVWLVQSITGLYRAAKIVWRDRFTDADPFNREFKAIEFYTRICLTDSRLLRVLHVGRNDAAGYFYYIMELADDAAATAGSTFNPVDYVARTLRADKDRRQFLPSDELLRLGVDLARALQALHQQGLVHRDLKPSNIVYVGGVPKLGDIGLVTDIREGATQVGTTGYVPPEGPGQPAADVFALGKILYEKATGKPARDFPILSGRAVPPDEMPRWRELNEIILKAAEPNLARRYPNAQELLNDLLLVEAGTSVRGWLQLRRQARWLKWAAVFLVALSVVSVSIAEMQRGLKQQAEATLNKLRQATYLGVQFSLLLNRHREARASLETLAAETPNQRPLEWRYLHQLALGFPDTRQQGPKQAITQLSISPDGSRLAALMHDRSVWLWPPNSTNALKIASNIVNLGPFVNDNSYPMVLNSANIIEMGLAENQPARLSGYEYLQAAAGSQWMLLKPVGSPTSWEVHGIAHSPEKQQLWLPNSKDTDAIKHATLTKDGTALANVRYTQINPWTNRITLELWRLPITAPTAEVILQHDALQISLSDDGQTVGVANGTTESPQIVNTRTHRVLSLKHPNALTACNTVAVEPNGQRVATGGTDGVIRIWASETGELLENLTGHAPTVSALVWSEDGRTLISGDSEGEIRTWKMTPSARIPTRLKSFWTGSFGNIALGQTSMRWAATTTNGNVGVWSDSAAERPSLILPDSFEPIQFSQQDQILWTYDATGWVRSWRLTNQTLLSESGPLVPAGTEIGKIVVNPEQQIAFALEFADGSLHRWDLLKHQRTHQTPPIAKQYCYMLEHVPSAAVVVTLATDGSFTCRDDRNLEAIFTDPGIPGKLKASGLAVSPDGRRVAVGSESGEIRIYDPLKNQIVQRVRSQTTAIMALAFPHDGRTLVASHESEVLSWLDLPTGTERVQMQLNLHPGPDHSQALFRLAFAQGDRQLIGLSNGSEVVRWLDLQP